MFIGSINQDLRGLLAELAPAWKDRSVYVGCSGNFTVERILAKEGVTQLHSNDISLYSCVVGRHLVGDDLEVRLKPDDQHDWMQPYLTPGVSTIAHLLLTMEYVKFVGRVEPYHRRMAAAYRSNWPTMHEKTVARVKAALADLRLSHFFAGDVVDHVRNAPQDAVVISFPPTYCVAPTERILTADLRWVPCGELVEGDRLLAFDEEPAADVRCRRWRFSTVTYSKPARQECVRVVLENGDDVVCTADHPWLADREDNNRGGARRSWVRADRLLTDAPYVLKQLNTWEPATSYDAGWVAGMFDGEGCIARSGTSRGVSWNLNIAQKMGPTADRVVDLLQRHGFPLGVHGGRPDGMRHISVTGGLSEALRALGTFRPVRLLQNFQALDAKATPCVRAQRRTRVKVVAVEPVGFRDIQSISTSTGTYVGEGYLMHNTGGYEKLYEAFEEIFDWQPPDYLEFDEKRFAELTSLMLEKQTWVTLRDEAVNDLAPHCIGSFQQTARSKPVYVYAGEGKSRISAPTQKLEAVPLGRLEGEGAGPLRIVRLTGGQMNFLRSQYLAPTIVPAAAQINLGVIWGDKIVGAIGLSQPQTGRGDWCDAYQTSDFAVRPAVYKRLSKLVLAAALSVEARAVLEQSFNRRVKRIGTTAFTKNAVSMKYRGLYTINNRKDGAVNYVAPAGKWTLEGALAWWLQHHGQARTGGGSREGAATLPSVEGGSKPSPRSTDEVLA